MLTTAYAFGLNKTAYMVPAKAIRSLLPTVVDKAIPVAAKVVSTSASKVPSKVAPGAIQKMLDWGVRRGGNWAATPFGAGTTGGAVLGAYRGYTHDRAEPMLGGITQGALGALGGGALGALAGRAFRPM